MLGRGFENFWKFVVRFCGNFKMHFVDFLVCSSWLFILNLILCLISTLILGSRGSKDIDPGRSFQLSVKMKMKRINKKVQQI